MNNEVIIYNTIHTYQETDNHQIIMHQTDHLVHSMAGTAVEEEAFGEQMTVAGRTPTPQKAAAAAAGPS